MPAPQLEDVIAVARFRTALRQFLRRTELVAAQHGLTPQRYLLLLQIKGAPDGTQQSTVTQLTERLQLAQHTVTELVTRAVESGLVRREASASDRRVIYLKLTAKGDAVLTRSFNALDADRRNLETWISRLHIH